MRVPKKPVLKVDLEEFHELENIKATLDGIRLDITRIQIFRFLKYLKSPISIWHAGIILELSDLNDFRKEIQNPV